VSAQHSAFLEKMKASFAPKIAVSSSSSLRTASQNAGRPQLAKYYQWSEDKNDWELTNTLKSTYNDAGNPLEEEILNYRGDSSDRNLFTYNQSGQMLTRVSQRWDSQSKGWVNDTKFSSEYDSQGNPILDQSFGWLRSSNSWILDSESRYKTTYDNLGRSIESTRETPSSEYYVRETFAYVGTDVAPITITNYTRQGNAWIPSERRAEVVWHNYEEAQMTSFSTQVWNGSDWKASTRTNISYKSNDFTVIEERILNDVWSPTIRFTSIDGASKTIFNYDVFENGIWIPISRSTNYLDSYGNYAGYGTEFYRDSTWTLEAYSYLTNKYNTEGDLLERIEEADNHNSKGKFKTVYEDFYYPEATSISSKLNEASVLVFPVPSNDVITVQNTFGEDVDFTLNDIVGKEASFSLEKGESKKVDISEYPSGVYILNIFTSSGKRSFQKIIKQ
jgi:hypothetical protein